MRVQRQISPVVAMCWQPAERQQKGGHTGLDDALGPAWPSATGSV